MDIFLFEGMTVGQDSPQMELLRMDLRDAQVDDVRGFIVRHGGRHEQNTQVLREHRAPRRHTVRRKRARRIPRSVHTVLEGASLRRAFQIGGRTAGGIPRPRFTGAQLNDAVYRDRSAGEPLYCCQATDHAIASEPIDWYSPMQYVRDVPSAISRSAR